jgi:hypothetical protein
MLAFPAKNPAYWSTIPHGIILSVTLGTVLVYEVGRETPTQLVGGYLALIAWLGTYSRNSYTGLGYDMLVLFFQ